MFEMPFPPYIFSSSMLQRRLLPVLIYDYAKRFVCCTSELEFLWI